MFKNWTVLKDKEGNHEYFYGELSEWIEDALSEDFEIVPENEITAKDFAVIFGNDLEDRNRHSMTDLGEIYLDSLKDLNLTPVQEVIVIKKFIELFEKKHM